MKHTNTTKSKQKPLPSKGLNKWDHISIHHDHIHPYPSSTDMNNHHSLLQDSLASQNSDKGQGHTKVLGGIARTAPLAAPNVLLCRTLCTGHARTPSRAKSGSGPFLQIGSRQSNVQAHRPTAVGAKKKPSNKGAGEERNGRLTS